MAAVRLYFQTICGIGSVVGGVYGAAQQTPETGFAFAFQNEYGTFLRSLWYSCGNRNPGYGCLYGYCINGGIYQEVACTKVISLIHDQIPVTFYCIGIQETCSNGC